MQRWRPELDPRTVDVLLCVGVVAVLSAVVSADQGADRPLNPFAYLWALGLGLLMLVRRSRPRLVLLLTVVGFFTYYMAGFPAIGVAVPIAAALYSAAEAGHLRAAVLTAVGVLSVSTTYRLLTGQSVALVVGYELVGHVSLMASVIALGYSVNAHRALVRRTEQVTGLVARQAHLDAEAQAAAERARLARELHDSLGHSLSVASLYSDVAREADDPTARRSALGQVRSAVGDSLTHLRSTVTLLRADARGPEPIAGLADVPALLEAPRAAGYDVVVDVEDVGPVDPLVSVTAYRVVQEAVTNTIRHSDARRLEVSVRPEGDYLVVRVGDNGARTRARRPPEGNGLRGMRERVEALRGRLEVCCSTEAWTVTAVLPREVPR